MELGTMAPSSVVAGLLGFLLVAGYLFAQWREQLLLAFQTLWEKVTPVLRTLRTWARENRFAVHQLLLVAMGAMALLICIWQKSWILASDPGSRPYDETLFQKLPLTVAALLTLFPTAMLVLKFTLPGMYRYLNYAYADASPELDLNSLPPAKRWIRAVVSLSVYLVIVFLGVLLFTGNL